MTVADTPVGTGAPKVAIFNDPKVRGAAIQIVLIALIAFLIYGMVSNAATNLAKAGIASGFGFLNVTAGFGINISPFVEYSETSTYGRVFLVGLQNTLVISIAGIFFATIIGFIVGVARLSSNWVIAKLAYAYVEIMRNIPLLLWIFIWYFSVLRLLPSKSDPINLGPFGLLNIAGYYAPKAVFAGGAGWIGIALIVAIVASFVLSFWAKRRQLATGEQFPVFWTSVAMIVGLPLIAYFLTGMPVSFELPTASRFGPKGGARIYPEFLGLLLALSLYTANYIGEIVRAGIMAISHGQTEAAHALGIRSGPTLRLVVIPQAMRVIIPPLTNQYLNLTKNSSLAVAIAYPDLVSVFAGTTLNQTGQAVEVLLMTMLTYLAISLLTSLLMNWFNAKMALVER
ncbi:MAG: amino acid ABC transporter permease [Salaquimonas sp.]|jgi:general L-amino acid transport system permease protein|nr:amino acid ABC transporter permease [Salaquimonas sp.]